MIFNMDKQITIFIFSILSGFLIGLFFDLYRIIRGNEVPGKIITAVEDLLFWTLTGILVFIFMMYTNYAYLSFNIFAYIAIGIFVYFKLISKLVINVLKNVFRIVQLGVRVLIYHVFYPIRVIFQKITKKYDKNI